MLVSVLVAPLLLLAVSLGVASFQPPAPIVQALAKRQVSIGSVSPLPSQCASTCSPVNNEVSLGCPVEACCSTSFETQYYNCLQCIGTVLDAGNYSTVQNSLNLLWTTCVDMGFVLPRLELPGQSNSSNATTTPSTFIPTASTPGGSITSATGAAVHCMWRGWQIQTLIGGAVLLVIAELW